MSTPEAHAPQKERSIKNAIIFCGNTGVGKSYLCNRIFELTKSSTKFSSSASTTRDTAAIQQGTILHTASGSIYTIVDTPGFFDNQDSDPKKQAKIDGDNMCKFVGALEACDQIFAIVFVFTDRFSLPHKTWYDRIKAILTPGKVGHILLLHNKQGPLDPITFAQNSLHIQGQTGEDSSASSYIWISYGAEESQLKAFLEKVVHLTPFTLNNLVVPEICYEKEEVGTEYKEVIAEAEKDEGHMEKLVRDTGHQETEFVNGERRYGGIAGPKNKIAVHKWVPGTAIDEVWVTKVVKRRTVGVFQNIYKIRFDGTKDLHEKKKLRTEEEVY